MARILQSINITVRWTADGTPVSLPSQMSFLEMREMLDTTRAPGARDSVVHALIIRDTDEPALSGKHGVTLDWYGFPRWAYGQSDRHPTVAECWSYATGEWDLQTAMKDSTGCIVRYSLVASEYDDQIQKNRWNYNAGNCLGIVLAHELGHALGLFEHRPEFTDVMSVAPGFDDGQDDRNKLATFDHFTVNAINDDQLPTGPRNAVNCRDLMGVHTVAVGW